MYVKDEISRPGTGPDPGPGLGPGTGARPWPRGRGRTLARAWPRGPGQTGTPKTFFRIKLRLAGPCQKTFSQSESFFGIKPLLAIKLIFCNQIFLDHLRVARRWCLYLIQQDFFESNQ